MPIRYSSVVGGSGSSGFNLDIGSSGNTTFVFDEPQPAGGYSITSQLTDATIEFYAIAEDGSLAGYTNTKALTASQDFTKMVVYGGTNNDLISFEYKPTTLPTGDGDQDSGAAPYIDSVNNLDLPSFDDTTIITGGNFATDVVVTFTGTDNVVRNAKSIVRTNSTQLIVTRPDDALEDYSPYSMTVSNPGIPSSGIKTISQNITMGSDPVWSTTEITPPTYNVPYSFQISATDPDADPITYSLLSGALPDGLSLSSSGVISGTVSATSGSFTFTILATDAAGNSTSREFTSNLFTPPTGGDTVESIEGYTVHTFTSNGTFQTVSPISNVEYLIIAGGGGGGAANRGGGGGAGGYRSSVVGEYSGELSVAENRLTLSGNTSYSVIVGAGGATQTTTTANSAAGGFNGENSSFAGIVSIGGGGGAASDSDGTDRDPKSGGSGGGGWYGVGGAKIGAAGTPGQGFKGGDGQNSPPYGGGGGGAGQEGFAASNGSNPCGGGNGIESSITGQAVYRAGGGSSANFTAASNYPGGLGGGGIGNNSSSAPTNGESARGAESTGSGGGASGQGGSGIVIIRYPS